MAVFIDAFQQTIKHIILAEEPEFVKVKDLTVWVL